MKIKTKDGEEVILAGMHIIESARIGDRIIKPKNENFVYLIKNESDTLRFVLLNISEETRGSEYFPKTWKNKYMEKRDE